MRWSPSAVIACVLFLFPLLSLADIDSGISAFKAGDYQKAIPLLQAAGSRVPGDPIVHADLLSALVYEGKVEEVSDAAEADATAFPSSPEVIAARGEFAFYMGDMPEAEKLFKAAIKLKEETARAYYGLYRVLKAASLHRTARLAILRAHEIDPDDALITRAWLAYLVPEKRKELEPPFIAAHPWFYQQQQAEESTTSDVHNELNGRKLFEPDGERKEATLHFIILMDSPTRPRGVGLEFTLEDGHPIRLLFDTGASGVLLRQGLVDKAGLSHLGSFTSYGIGDKGAKASFASVANTCAVGPLKYKACLVRVLEGKGRVGGEEDGLIGADFFSDYIIEIDFQKRQMHLTPHPPRDPNPQGYDRAIPPEEKSFTPVFRFGHHLYVLTKLNNQSTGLFLLDTGSSMSAVDSTFARLSTKIRGDPYRQIRGISGSVKDVFEADKALIQFARFQQRNLGLTSFNLNNMTEHQEVRMAGILGLPVLAMFRLTIDYRNGLVNFDYVLKQH